MDINELFWSSNIEGMKKGYIYIEENKKYICLICGESFERGIIYKTQDNFCDAEKAVEVHISEKHGSMFDYLINMNKKYTGISEIQQQILNLFMEGKSDKDISEIMSISQSTVRNHRFKLKEKEKQAKIFLSIMETLNSSKTQELSKQEKLIGIHKGASMVDERYAITESEKEKILDSYFTGEDRMVLKNFPSKEKRKIVVLQHIAENFNSNKKYTEKEVNNILKRIYEDYVLIRRYLIEYGFMDRHKDCSSYWVKE